MGGLARLCKLYGSMKMTDATGKKVTLVWDYVNDKARLETEMTKEEIMESHKAKYIMIKDQIK